MASSWRSWALSGLLLLGELEQSHASTLVQRSTNTTSVPTPACTQLNQRKSWRTLTDTEKADYIQAEKCLLESPAKAGIEGAQTRWDEVQWVHLVQSNFVHGVGQFLPWHRLYVRLHETLLQTECNYTGAQPYWDEAYDHAMGSGFLANSSIWGSNDTSFGSNGQDGDGCVVDGPFANTTLRLNQEWGVNNYTEYCLSRDFDDTDWGWANSTYVDACFAYDTYDEVWSCFSSKPHSGAHVSVGGTLYDQSASPGDPVFFLHHTNLDRLWWQWQQQNTSRLTQIGGQTIPSQAHLTAGEWLFPSAAFLNYSGDPVYNVTSLTHVLWMAGIMDNATIADVMDSTGDRICADYIETYD